jgi:hypothetical protein
MKFNQQELEREVHVTAPIVGRWDGKDVDFTKGVTIKYGLLVHFQNLHKDAEFKVEEVRPSVRDPKEIVNPLEANDRGEAFAGLKRTRKPKEVE